MLKWFMKISIARWHIVKFAFFLHVQKMHLKFTYCGLDVIKSVAFEAKV